MERKVFLAILFRRGQASNPLLDYSSRRTATYKVPVPSSFLIFNSSTVKIIALYSDTP